MNTGLKIGKKQMLTIDNQTWEYWSARYDWVRQMDNVPQDSIHHAEGNVAVHTQMVLEALTSLPEYKELTQTEQSILWYAALMHDIEKRSTTVVDEHGRISSPGHAKKGERTVRQILYQNFVMPFEYREQIAKLVRYHGLPLWIFEKTSPEQTLIKASLEVDTKLLAMLAKADVLGRICEDQKQFLEKVALFELLCQEQECWGTKRAFPSNYSRFEFFRQESLYPDTLLFDESKVKVILLSGIAGTGKDYWIQKNCGDIPVISLDDLRRKLKISPTDTKGNGKVIQLAKEQAKEYLRNQQSFVWNATNITMQMREQLISLFVSYRAFVEIVYLEVPYKTLLQQNSKRQAVVPEKVIQRMIEKWEVPNLWEAHEVKYVCK